jgi:hypothetical protein
MNEAASTITVEIATQFLLFVRSLDQNWSRAYYRFMSEDIDAAYGSNASFVTESGVFLIDAIENRSFFFSMNKQGWRLFEALGMKKGVFLLCINEDKTYNMMFEWDDLQRWRITKMEGRSGIPEGV